MSEQQLVSFMAYCDVAEHALWAAWNHSKDERIYEALLLIMESKLEQLRGHNEDTANAQ